MTNPSNPELTRGLAASVGQPALPRGGLVPPLPHREQKDTGKGLTTRREAIVKAGKGLAGLGVASLVGKFIWDLATQGQKEGSNTFDNQATSGVIGDNNTVKASLAEIQKQFSKPIIENGNTMSFILPFRPLEGTGTQYQKGLSDRLPTKDLQKEAEQKGIKDYVDFTLAKDTVIYLPFNGYTYISMGKEEFNRDPTKATGLLAVYYDKDQDKTYLIRIFALDDGGQKRYLNSLSPDLQLPPSYPSAMLRGDNWKHWPAAQEGHQLVQTTQNQSLRITVEAYKGDKIGPEAAITDKALSLLTPQFLTVPTPEGPKILVLTQ